MDVTLYNYDATYLKNVEGKKNSDIICYMLTSLLYLQQGSIKKSPN